MTLPRRRPPPLPPDPMIPDPAAITQVVRETPDTLSFHLQVEGGLRFAPGQFNMLYLYGVGELPISISGDPERPEETVHTIRAVGGVSMAMQALRKGDSLGVRGPYGNAWPVEEARDKDVVIVAGGLGLAPLRSVVYHLIHNRDQYRRVAVLYGARSPVDLLYQREMSRWEHHDVSVRTTVDRRQIGWAGRVGVVTTLFHDLHLDPLGTVAMVCGPEEMMHKAMRDLAGLGIPHDRLYVAMERNMKCGVGLCGHCQYGQFFVCKDGPVFRFDDLASLFLLQEV